MDSKDASHYDLLLLNRIRIGHSRQIHLYLLSSDNLPMSACKKSGL